MNGLYDWRDPEESIPDEGDYTEVVVMQFGKVKCIRRDVRCYGRWRRKRQGEKYVAWRPDWYWPEMDAMTERYEKGRKEA